MSIESDSDEELLRRGELDRLGPRWAETAYDDLTRLAADICGTPIALITVLESGSQWFTAGVGSYPQHSARELAFCTQALRNPSEVMVIEDASADPRFRDSPSVTGEAHIRFYAGAPLVTSAGQAIGTLCVLDREPRKIDPAQLEELRFLAQQVVTTMERRRDAAAAQPDSPRQPTPPRASK